MSMLQMVGGVAVAGAVAAGTTAFTATASGLTTVGINAPQLGGGVIVTVAATTANLGGVSFRQTDLANPNRVTGATVSVDDGAGVALASTSTVRVALTGTAAGSPLPVSGTTYAPCVKAALLTWTCDFTAGGYFTDVTNVLVSVVPGI